MVNMKSTELSLLIQNLNLFIIIHDILIFIKRIKLYFTKILIILFINQIASFSLNYFFFK